MATNPIGLSLCFFRGYEPGFDIGLHPPAIAANGFGCVEIGPNAFACSAANGDPACAAPPVLASRTATT